MQTPHQVADNPSLDSRQSTDNSRQRRHREGPSVAVAQGGEFHQSLGRRAACPERDPHRVRQLIARARAANLGEER